MPSPFPGMDPYIESPSRWGDFHTQMMADIRALLNPLLRPNYVVRIEERVYISEETDPGRRWIVPDLHVVVTGSAQGAGPARPTRTPQTAVPPEAEVDADVAQAVDVSEQLHEQVRERFLQIVDVTRREVLTTIELLSPGNKVRGSQSREEYLSKRRAVIASGVGLVEIDLLRQGERGFVPQNLPEHDYQVYVSRWVGGDRKGWVWPVLLRQRLPAIPVPLREGDADVTLDLQAAVTRAYDVANYDLEIDYARDPDVPLSPATAAWADGLLRTKDLRSR